MVPVTRSDAVRVIGEIVGLVPRTLPRTLRQRCCDRSVRGVPGQNTTAAAPVGQRTGRGACAVCVRRTLIARGPGAHMRSRYARRIYAGSNPGVVLSHV